MDRVVRQGPSGPQKKGQQGQKTLQRGRPEDETLKVSQLQMQRTSSYDLPSEMMSEVFSYLDRGDLLTCRSTCKRWKALSMPYLAGKSAIKDLIPILSSQGLLGPNVWNLRCKMTSLKLILGLFPHDLESTNWRGQVPFSELTLQSNFYQSHFFGPTSKFLSVYGRSITHLVLWITSYWETTYLFIDFWKDLMQKLPNLVHAKVLLLEDFELADWELHSQIYDQPLTEPASELPQTNLKSLDRQTVFNLLMRSSASSGIEKFSWFSQPNFHPQTTPFMLDLLLQHRINETLQHLDLQKLPILYLNLLDLLSTNKFIRLKYLRFGNWSTCTDRRLGPRMVEFLRSVAGTLECLIFDGLFPWRDGSRENPYWILGFHFPFMDKLKILEIKDNPGLVKLFPNNSLTSVPDLNSLQIHWSHAPEVREVNYTRDASFTSLPPSLEEEADFFLPNLRNLKIIIYIHPEISKIVRQIEMIFTHFPNLIKLDICFDLPEDTIWGFYGWRLRKVLMLLSTKNIRELTLRLHPSAFEQSLSSPCCCHTSCGLVNRNDYLSDINSVLEKTLPSLKSVQKLVLRHFGVLQSRTVWNGILKMDGLTALSLQNVTFERQEDAVLMSVVVVLNDKLDTEASLDSF